MTQQEKQEKKLQKQREKEAKKEAKARKNAMDTETTFADMNVEGFHWYDPSRKGKNPPQKMDLSKKEYWAMVRGAFRAMFPMFACMFLVALLMFALAWVWLQ